MNESIALVIFFKNFELGHVKTRIAASVGDEEALNIYQSLCTICATKFADISVRRYVYYSKSIISEDVWDVNAFDKRLQSSGDLGVKITTALQEVFQYHDKVLIVGTDCPFIEAPLLQQAFDALDEHDIVIGPTEDGGYYLLGLQTMEARLFQNITWSSESVFDETLQAARDLGLSSFVLDRHFDIDYIEDWNRFLQIKTHKI